ncbi:MAG: diguanylate cyclase/phosphodiesterase (GGDEF & EAL domains) with PAS/PAC sensor(s) [Nitrospira sp.]|jgi:hypothetical protein|nr:MAG: diguanylate cyclase/phosphodiesterase (GGDEF & EAL domains) with PAS/PAC sensor(s) [Nitrospira sp.]
MSALLTQELIASTIEQFPIQGRIMLKLLLLQHFDITPEEISYIAADRPDPRCVAGTKPIHQVVTQDALRDVTSRRDEYRRRVRLRRERLWLQMEAMRGMMALAEGLVRAAEELLHTKFNMHADAVNTIKQQARAAVPKPAIRLLERRWDENDITAEAYQEARLGLEMQTQLRLLEKYRKRFELSEREWKTINAAPMQEHEVGHIWGIPAGSLAARKVKYLHQYLQALQTSLQRSSTQDVPVTAPLDLWKETLAVLAERPVERSIAVYDGLERTEDALVDKLHKFVWGTLGEDLEAKFWLSLVHGASSNAVHSEPTRSLFGLQRLMAILAEVDGSPDALEQELLTRTAPTAKETLALADEAAQPATEEVGQMKQHVLNSFIGELRDV